jgi:hypothetical protein
MKMLRFFLCCLIPYIFLAGCKTNQVEGAAESAIRLPVGLDALYVEVDGGRVSLFDGEDVARLFYNRLLDTYPADVDSPRLVFRSVRQGIPAGATGVRVQLMRWELDRSNSIECQFSASLIIPGEEPVHLGLFSGTRFLLSANTNRDIKKAYFSAGEQAAKKLWRRLPPAQP